VRAVEERLSGKLMQLRQADIPPMAGAWDRQQLPGSARHTHQTRPTAGTTRRSSPPNGAELPDRAPANTGGRINVNLQQGDRKQPANTLRRHPLQGHIYRREQTLMGLSELVGGCGRNRPQANSQRGARASAALSRQRQHNERRSTT